VGDPRKFHYLNQSNCIELDGVDDSKEYLATKRAMEVVGISSEEQVPLSSIPIGECVYVSSFFLFIVFIRNICHPSSQDDIFRIVAAILHLGNVDFVKGVVEVFDSSQPKDENSYFHLKTAAELLM